MRRLAALAFAAASAAAAAAPAAAALQLEGVHWQVARVEGGRVVSWGSARQLEDGPPKLETRLRARLVVKNAGDKAEEGVLLRYSMTARLSPAEGSKREGVWGVPFAVDEKRVPKVGPGQTVEVFLSTSPALELYLRRLGRAGWWPDRLKLQVMIEPHSTGQDPLAVESVLEVRK